MKRNVKTLYSETYDLIIIGGGVHGLCAAWDAALRGLKVALVEKGDFGHATSSGSYKLIHGGLRYLQHLDIRRIRISILERRRMTYMAPHLVHPLAFVLPCYGHGRQGPHVMRVALWLNDLISHDRNHNVTDSRKHIPRGHILSQKKTLERIPLFQPHGLTGGAVFYDAQIYNSERLTLSFGLSAAGAGAQLANYVEATGFLKQGSTLSGIHAKDALTGETFDIQGSLVINMTGPWSAITSSFLAKTPAPRTVHLSKGIQLFTRPLCDTACAFAIPSPQIDRSKKISRGNRMYFVTPWHNTSFIGTTDEPYAGDPDAFTITQEDITAFIDELNQALPSVHLTPRDVRSACGGLRPMDDTGGRPGSASAANRHEIVDHAERDGIAGLISVIGVKYTTCRYVAERTIDLALKKLNRPLLPCVTHTTRLWGGEIEHIEDFMNGSVQKSALPPEATRRLVYHYGSEVNHILPKVQGDTSPFIPGSDTVLHAEILHAIREEMAVKLSDVIFRRIGAGTADNPGNSLLENCARIMADELDWTAERKTAELDEVKKKLAYPS